jgi:hypothetical protein
MNHLSLIIGVVVYLAVWLLTTWFIWRLEGRPQKVSVPLFLGGLAFVIVFNLLMEAWL